MSPYIPKKRREDLWNSSPQNAGELNYIITAEILDYLKGRIPANTMREENNYTDYNEVIGVLRLVELELWDRLIQPYEKKKRELNGDVFE